MKKVISMVVCATLVLMVAGIAMAGGKGKGDHKKGDDFFTKADTDKDGKLSLAEFKAAYTGTDAEAKFAAADTDKDGFLTREEFKAAKLNACKKHSKDAPAPADAPAAVPAAK